MDSATYDVIIAGGGPSGLSLASELSADWRVLVLEKGVAGTTQRSWFVPRSAVEGNPSLEGFYYGGVNRFLGTTFSGGNAVWEARFEKNAPYPFIKETELLPHWVNVINSRANGSKVLSPCSYISHEVDAQGVSVSSSSGVFRGRVLIDCTGYNSEIAKNYEISREGYYWWSVYGAVGKHPGGVKGMQVGDYMLWQTFQDTNVDPDANLQSGRPVFEYEILDENTSFSLILYLRRERVSREDMKPVFEHVIRKEDATSNFHDIEIVEEKFGWYPSGSISQDFARDRVMFAGDSACWTTPCGWGMGFILSNYRSVCAKLSKALQDDTLDVATLTEIPKFRTRGKGEVALNAIVTHFLSNAPENMLDRFIQMFNPENKISYVDPIYCEKIFTLDIEPEEIPIVLKAMLKAFSVKELWGILPPDDYHTLLEAAVEMGEDAILKEVHALFDENGEPVDNLRNGFQFGGAAGAHGAKPADENSFANWSDKLKAAINQDISLVGQLLTQARLKSEQYS